MEKNSNSTSEAIIVNKKVQKERFLRKTINFGKTYYSPFVAKHFMKYLSVTIPL